MLPPVRAEDLPLLHALSTPAVAPDGSRAVVSAVHPNFEADAYVGQLWTVPLDGSGPRRITRGFRDTAPEFSPDGRLLAFLRAAQGAAPQLAVMPVDGGEPMVITDAKLGVREFAFSQDSKKLAFVAEVPQEGRYGSTAGVDPAHEDPRLIDALQFQLNGVGYLADRRPQIFVIDVPDLNAEPVVAPVGRAADCEPVSLVPAAAQLTTGDYEHYGLAWDGDAVVAISARHEARDRDLRTDLYRFAPGAEPQRLTDSFTGPSALASPVVVGDHIFFAGIELGPTGRDVVGTNVSVCVLPRAGGEVRVLTDPETVGIEGDLVADGDGVLAVDQVRGTGHVLRVDAAGEQQRWPLPGVVRALGAAGGVRLAVLTRRASPCELFTLDDPEAPLTSFGEPMLAGAIVPQEQVATAADGYPVHGWVLRPSGEGPHPVVLMIHGGPFAAYTPAFFDEAQVLAEAGYAVLMCNPRGSAGYGQAHARAIKGALGELDMADVLAFLDHCLVEVPGLDASRVGVMGGSYGGYLTAWLIAHTARFAAAIVERGYLDPRSMIGATDIGWYFPEEYHHDLAAMDRQSPLYLVHQVTTPTLVIHSEQDLRCPLATAQRYYTELKLRGVETEMLIFPGENHELSRSGTPHHRRARFEHILAWWERHLRG